MTKRKYPAASVPRQQIADAPTGNTVAEVRRRTGHVIRDCQVPDGDCIVMQLRTALALPTAPDVDTAPWPLCT